MAQLGALKLIALCGRDAIRFVHDKTLRSLRRVKWATGCFEPLALTDKGRKVLENASRPPPIQ